jgi:hypothetical protein
MTAGASGKSAPGDGWLGGFGRWNAGQSHLAGQIDDRSVARLGARRWFRLTKRGFILPIGSHRVHYLRRSFEASGITIKFNGASVNFPFVDLLARAEDPR